MTARFLGELLHSRLRLPLYTINGVIAISLRDRARLPLSLARYGLSDPGRKKDAA